MSNRKRTEFSGSSSYRAHPLLRDLWETEGVRGGGRHGVVTGHLRGGEDAEGRLGARHWSGLGREGGRGGPVGGGGDLSRSRSWRGRNTVAQRNGIPWDQCRTDCRLLCVPRGNLRERNRLHHNPWGRKERDKRQTHISILVRHVTEAINQKEYMLHTDAKRRGENGRQKSPFSPIKELRKWEMVRLLIFFRAGFNHPLPSPPCVWYDSWLFWIEMQNN